MQAHNVKLVWELVAERISDAMTAGTLAQTSKALYVATRRSLAVRVATRLFAVLEADLADINSATLSDAADEAVNHAARDVIAGALLWHAAAACRAQPHALHLHLDTRSDTRLLRACRVLFCSDDTVTAELRLPSVGTLPTAALCAGGVLWLTCAFTAEEVEVTMRIPSSADHRESFNMHKAIAAAASLEYTGHQVAVVPCQLALKKLFGCDKVLNVDLALWVFDRETEPFDQNILKTFVQLFGGFFGTCNENSDLFGYEKFTNLYYNRQLQPPTGWFPLWFPSIQFIHNLPPSTWKDPLLSTKLEARIWKMHKQISVFVIGGLLYRQVTVWQPEVKKTGGSKIDEDSDNMEVETDDAEENSDIEIEINDAEEKGDTDGFLLQGTPEFDDILMINKNIMDPDYYSFRIACKNDDEEPDFLMEDDCNSEIVTDTNLFSDLLVDSLFRDLTIQKVDYSYPIDDEESDFESYFSVKFAITRSESAKWKFYIHFRDPNFLFIQLDSDNADEFNNNLPNQILLHTNDEFKPVIFDLKVCEHVVNEIYSAYYNGSKSILPVQFEQNRDVMPLIQFLVCAAVTAVICSTHSRRDWTLEKLLVSREFIAEPITLADYVQNCSFWLDNGGGPDLGRFLDNILYLLEEATGGAQFPTLNKTLHQRRQTTPAPPLSSSSKKNASVSAAPTNSAKTRHVGTVNKKIKSALSARFKNLDASIKTAAADAFGSGLAGSSRKPTIVAMTTEKLPKSKDAAATTAKLKSAKKSIEAFMNIDFGEEENDNDSVLNLHDDRDSNNEDFDDAEDLLASAIARGSDNSDDNDDDDDDDGENGDSDDLEIDEIMRNGGGFFANRPEKETVAVALMKKKKKTASVPVVNNASAAVVTVDVNMSRGPRVGGGREWRAVMASDVRKMNLDAKPKAETTTASRETAEQDRDDDEKDR
ncbi:hypothetical protein HK100_006917, partial [Physocladia obscura]